MASNRHCTYKILCLEETQYCLSVMEPITPMTGPKCYICKPYSVSLLQRSEKGGTPRTYTPPCLWRRLKLNARSGHTHLESSSPHWATAELQRRENNFLFPPFTHLDTLLQECCKSCFPESVAYNNLAFCFRSKSEAARSLHAVPPCRSPRLSVPKLDGHQRVDKATEIA